MLIYTQNITDFSETELNAMYDAMSDERRETVNRIAVKKKRVSKIVADYLCRKAISDFCGVRPQKIEFKKNNFGKPFANNLPVYFSVSHSGDMVVCAVSDKEVGIDIEKIQPINLKAAEKFATAQEINYINSTENGFFEIWTLKEAYFKCIGTGLGADIKNVSFSIKPDRIECSERGYDLKLLDIGKEYICSVCVNSNI